MSKFTTGMIAELIALDKARKGGVGAEVQELIRRLTDGGVTPKSDDPRVIQAKRYWDLGWGRELAIDSFDVYLATIPQIPASLLEDDEQFPLLVLVDPRLGITKTCSLGGIFNGDDNTFVPVDARHETPLTPFWVRLHDGRRNRGKKPVDCRIACTGNEFAMTAMVGVCAYLHFPSIVKQGEHVIDLPGSVPREYRGYVAFFLIWDGKPGLVCHGGADAHSGYGAGSLRRE